MLNEKNFLQRALRAYDNPQCVSVDEFKADLDRFSHIKKIITRYKDCGGALNERLILNHLVICFNVFGDQTIPFSFHKVPESNWGILAPFLILLNRLPDRIEDLMINTSEISLDLTVVDALRKV